MELLDAAYSTIGTATTHNWHYCRCSGAHYQTLSRLVAKEFIMKDTINIDIDTFMQRAIELANDPTAGQPNLSAKALQAATGQNEHTLDAFIKQGLMPNAQRKCWTKRQAHLFSGLCAIEQWYDTYIMTLRARLPVAPKRQNSKHVMFLRGHLLIWAWVACGEQYGITLDQVKNVMCHWATHAAKLPEAMISGDAHDIVGCNISWKNANDIVDCNISRKSEAIRHIKAALRGLREKRQQARTLSKSLPLPFADYEEYHHLI